MSDRGIMQVHIVRHAVAEPRGLPGYPDDDRPLTEGGAEMMAKAARGIARIIEPPGLILTSPLVRARHTARIVATALGCEDRVQREDILLPGVPTPDLLQFLSGFKELSSFMIVGHEPVLGLLAAALLRCEALSLDIKEGSFMTIEVESWPHQKHGRLLHFLSQKQLRLVS